MYFWLVDHVSKHPDGDPCFFVAILWSLWQSRNNLVFQNIKEINIAALMRARDMLLTRKLSLIASPMVPIGVCDKWMPLPTGWRKCDTDGAYDEFSGNNGAGFVMRNFSNTASFCACIVFEVDSAEEAEARDIWAALKKNVEQNLTHLIIESDAHILTNKFSADLFDGDSRTDAIFKDVQFFSSSLIACLFTFQPCICNSVANELALWAKTNNSIMYWSVSPIWMMSIVDGDH
ncbi:uncharacterized protein LOC113360503 [Papaver somniferum]|uniref:uncharacterized protein LOC113360503 n=1 Tax=Papaver somniferum TaxID=3469 RepID=UPI000E7056AF|nr:uncharacterized protein LOC113360503 [Papaver somniferum]